MELRQYGRIVRRHLWVVVLLPLVALIAGLLFRSPSVPLYQATVRVTIGVVPPPNTSPTGEDLYNYELASEYFADDFSEVVKSGAFAQDVSHRLRTQGVEIQPGAIQGFTVAQKQHRILSIIITWPDEEEGKAIAQATIAALEEESNKYFPQLGVAGAQLFVIDGPSIPGWAPVRLGPSLRERLDLPIRVVLGLIAGLGLAFLLEYLDDTIREAKEVEALGIPILGRIPAPSIWERLRHWRP
jgi:capsular polysaccharide biosynthesis protein